MVREPADAVLVVTDRAAFVVFWRFEVLNTVERGVGYQRIV